MARRTIYITEQDAQRLQEWLRISGHRQERDRANVEALRRELERAELTESSEIDPAVVTMHSRVLVEDTHDGQQTRYELVFPDEAVAAPGRISVLAPLGSAILGCRAGDVVRFEAPAGRRSVRIVKVIHQPESAGSRRGATTARRPAGARARS
jgi:regulator of nucleoside diphosphate kinase